MNAAFYENTAQSDYNIKDHYLYSKATVKFREKTEGESLLCHQNLTN